MALMSALGHHLTFGSAIVMSALPPKADMCGATWDVRFGPIATNAPQTASLFNDPSARVKRRDCSASREVDGVHNTLAEYTKRSTPGANPFALIPTCTFAISQQGDEDYRHENVHVRRGPGVVRRVVR
jgi:hypothetical protein